MSDTTTTTSAPVECTSDCIYYCIHGVATLFYNDCSGDGCGCIDTYSDPSCGTSGRYMFVPCAQTTTTTTTTTTTPDPNTSTTTTTPEPTTTTSTSTTSTTTTESPCGQQACVWTWTEAGWTLRYQYNPCSELGCGSCPEPAYPCDWNTLTVGDEVITYCVATTTTTPAPTTTTTTTTTLGPTTTTTACAGCGFIWNSSWQQAYNRCSGSCVCPSEYLPTEGVENEVFELPCLVLGTTTTAYPCARRCKWQWRTATGQWTRMTYPCAATCPCPPPTETGTEDCQIVETACTLTTTTTTTTLPPCTGGCSYICTSGVYVLVSTACGSNCVCPDISCWTCTGGMEGNDAWASCVHPGENPWCTTTTQSPCGGKCVYRCNNTVWTLTGNLCSGSGCGCNPQPGPEHYCGAGTGTLETECVVTTTTTAAPCVGSCRWYWSLNDAPYRATGALNGYLYPLYPKVFLLNDSATGETYYVYWMPANSPFPAGWKIQTSENAQRYTYLVPPYWVGPYLAGDTPVGSYWGSGGSGYVFISTHAAESKWIQNTNPCTAACPCAEPGFAGTINGQTEYTMCGSPESCWPTMSLFDFANIDLPGFAVLRFCGVAERFWAMMLLSDFADTDVLDFAVLPL